MPRGRRLPVVLTEAEDLALWAEADASIENAKTSKKKFAAKRDCVMIAVGGLAGLRVSELCNLNVENVDLEAPKISVIGGKGDKDRNIPIGKLLLPLLEAWIADRRSGPMFTGPNGRRLAPRTFQERIDALGRRARIVKRVHPHLLRHTFATSLLRTGSTITEVQELLGHDDIQTTAIYLHVERSRLKQNVDRL